jgi:hypothetical protein
MHARLESVKHSGDPESPVEIFSRIERVIIDDSPSDTDAEDIQATIGKAKI